MEIIDDEELKNVPAFPARSDVREVSDDEFKRMVSRLSKDPIGNLEELATRLQLIVQERITFEKEGPRGEISPQTRQWMQMLIDALDKIQKARYGEKRINVNAQIITHSDISEFVRQHAPKEANRIFDQSGSEE